MSRATPTNVDDTEALMAALRARDERALARLYDRYGQAVYGLAARLTGDADVAEEITVDAFWQLWQRAERFDGTVGSLRNWLFTIARRRAIDRLRTRVARTRTTAEDPTDASPARRSEDDAELAERRRLVRAARDDLPRHAPGDLEPEERAAVGAALAADPDLAAELRQWPELVGLVALDVPDTAPAEVRDRLIARVRGAAAAPSATIARRPGWQVPLAAVAALLLATLGYREVGFRAERTRAGETLAALQRALTARESDLIGANAALSARERDIAALRAALAGAQESLALLQERGLGLVSLREAPEAPPAEGHILLSRSSRRAVFYAFGLPAISADRVYELWWITETEGPVRAGIFHPDAHGVGRVEAALPGGGGAIQAAAVTVEAAGGVPRPLGPMVLVGNAR
jgi:RNA polymerase sigma-70 factor (ECF subfamily)